LELLGIELELLGTFHLKGTSVFELNYTVKNGVLWDTLSFTH